MIWNSKHSAIYPKVCYGLGGDIPFNVGTICKTKTLVKAGYFDSCFSFKQDAERQQETKCS